MMENEKPISVTIIGILEMTIGILGLVSILISLLFSKGDFIIRLMFFLSVVFLPVGIGILFLKDWARKLTLVLVYLLLAGVIYFLCGVMLLAYGFNRGFSASLIKIYITFFLRAGFFSSPLIFTLYYLTRPKVKEQFSTRG